MFILGWEARLSPPVQHRRSDGLPGDHDLAYGPPERLRGYVKMGGAPYARSVLYQNCLWALVGYTKPVCCASRHLPSRLYSDQLVSDARIRGLEIGLKLLKSPCANRTRETVLEE